MVDFRKVDAALLERICSDAKIALADEEKDKFVKEMSEILDAFKSISEADTNGLQPSYHSTPVENVWREDVADGGKRKLDIGKNTEAIEDGYIIGPKLV